MGKKLTEEDIRERLKNSNKGIVYVSGYTKAIHKATFECLRGHRFEAIVNNVLRGSGCPICWKENHSTHRGSFKRFTEEEIKEELSSRGITIVGGSRSDMQFKCAHGHIWRTRLSNIMSNHSGCPFCAGRRISNKELKDLLASRGFTLLTNYENSYTKMYLECSKGHKWSTTLESLKNSENGCPFCAIIKRIK